MRERSNELVQQGGFQSGGPHWAAIVEAVSAAVSALLLIGGAWFAQRYLARANTSVEATLFEHSDGFGLHVRPSIQSLGLSPLRLRHEDQLAPVIEVSEYRSDDGSSFSGPRRETFNADDLRWTWGNGHGQRNFPPQPPVRELSGGASSSRSGFVAGGDSPGVG